MLLYIGEDDLALAAGMKFTLEREEYEVETFGTCGARRRAGALQTHKRAGGYTGADDYSQGSGN